MCFCFICVCIQGVTTQVDWHFFFLYFFLLTFVEDDPADVDFEPDSETDKAIDKVIYLLNCSAWNGI